MTILSQLDTVLALEKLEQEMRDATTPANGDPEVLPVLGSTVRQWAAQLAAIHAAVGGEVVAWPSVAKRVGDDWEARTALVTHSMSEAQANTWNACRAACVGAYSRAKPLYASPAATVDVGAKECRWTYDTDTLTDTAWDTECGHRHQFTSDGPAENEHKFCPYCGGKLAALIGEKA